MWILSIMYSFVVKYEFHFFKFKLIKSNTPIFRIIWFGSLFPHNVLLHTVILILFKSRFLKDRLHLLLTEVEIEIEIKAMVKAIWGRGNYFTFVRGRVVKAIWEWFVLKVENLIVKLPTAFDLKWARTGAVVVLLGILHC